MNTNKKTIIIFGASGGIGSVLTRCFIQAGYNVVLSARDRIKLQMVADEFDALSVLVVPADASNDEQVQYVFSEATRTFGSVEAVIMSAGTFTMMPLDTPIKEAIALMRKHFDMFYMTSFVPGLIAAQFFKKQGHGFIVNISSHAAIKPELPNNFSYGPMKAASHDLILRIRNAVTGTNVRVSDLLPAATNTPEANLTAEERELAVQPEDIAQWIIENIDNPDPAASTEFKTSVMFT
jgi:NADP-dependent 3-hydroxy acid dehydrogenase YdfG